MTERVSNIFRDSDRPVAGAALHIDVIADFVCPFCFVGKRRLDVALKAVKGPYDVSWYPFQLNPDLPDEGLPFDEYLVQRFESRKNVQPVLDHLVADGRSVGIDFDFDGIRHVPNTLRVHQVMQLAEDKGIDQSAMAEDLMSSFFERGRNIGERDTLIEIAGRFGLGAAEVIAAIESDRVRQIVLAREEKVRSSGLAGVPGFLINRRLLVVGAQSTESLVNAFDRAMFGESADTLVSPAVH